MVDRSGQDYRLLRHVLKERRGGPQTMDGRVPADRGRNSDPGGAVAPLAPGTSPGASGPIQARTAFARSSSTLAVAVRTERVPDRRDPRGPSVLQRAARG